MEIGVHRHRRFQVHPWPGTGRRSGARKPVNTSYSKQHPSRMCAWPPRSACPYPQFSFTLGPQSSCWHKSVLAICVSRLQAKGRQHHVSQNIVRRLLSLPDLFRLPCEREMNKETVPLKLFKVQSSSFKKLTEKVGRPKLPRFRRPAPWAQGFFFPYRNVV